MKKIDADFIDNIRFNLAIRNWIFDESDKQIEIIPENLTHSYLLRNFVIDNSILSYYYLPTSNLLTDKEYKEHYSNHAGSKETLLTPYSNVLFGAYYLRTDLISKIESLIYSPYKTTLQGKEVREFEDLTPYFKEYANGFQDGFNNFDEVQIKPYLSLLGDKQEYVSRVFEFITKSVFLTHGWANLRKGFTVKCNGKDKVEEIINAYKDGQTQGYFYRAWSIVLSSSNLFSSLFNSLNKEQEQHPDENPYPELFSEESYKLFVYLDDNYKRDNKGLKAKYSFIYHYLKYVNEILGTQDLFIEFIEKEYGVKLSKIQPKHYKYYNEIKPVLSRLHTQFKKQSKY